MANLPSHDDVLSFWFNELTPKQHFIKSEAVDKLIRNRFLTLHEALNENSCDFITTPRGKLAAIIVFDQFSRNMFRGRAEAFKTDDKALLLAKTLISEGDDLAFMPNERSYIYMPFMHSEVLADQHESVRLFDLLEDESNLIYAKKHLDVIKRFGRFPHRNAALARLSTKEEAEFISTPGTAF